MVKQLAQFLRGMAHVYFTSHDMSPVKAAKEVQKRGDRPQAATHSHVANQSDEDVYYLVGV